MYHQGSLHEAAAGRRCIPCPNYRAGRPRPSGQAALGSVRAGWLATRGEPAGSDWLACLGRVGAAHPAAALRGPLVLVQPAPGAVLFRPAQRVAQTLRPHRAGGADGLSLTLADFPFWLTLAVRTKKQHDITTAARGVILPAPVRPLHQGGLTTYLRHDLLSSSTSSPLHSCQAERRAPWTHSFQRDAAFAPSHDTTHGKAVVFPAWIAAG